jgi:hypothetical protein
MALQRELRTFLRRTNDGAYRLEAEDGSLVIYSRSYRQLRRDLEVVLRALPGPRDRLKILIGSPPRSSAPPRSAPRPDPSAVQLELLT